MRVKISAEQLHSDFVKKVEELSGQSLLSCYQCGKCSAGCPMSFAMDNLPNQVIRLMQLGLEDDIAKSNTIWICASCITCSVRCPRGVDIARVMEALRILALRNKHDYVDLKEITPERIADMPQIAMVSSFRKHTC
ncbi:MAG: 4Fe-4S dicluster domain-containing protein [Chloroflexota bacterium]|nr:4Fe-4S dicluster domain-containing protein [Chloroflexota bacterium]